MYNEGHDNKWGEELRRILSHAVVFALGTLFAGSSVAMAATVYVQAERGSAVVYWNSHKMASPSTLVNNNTTYVQLYALQQGLKQSGYTAAWDGHNLRILSPAQPVLEQWASARLTPQNNSVVQGTATLSLDIVHHLLTVAVTLQGLAPNSVHPLDLMAAGQQVASLNPAIAGADGTVTVYSVVSNVAGLPNEGWSLVVRTGPDEVGPNATPIASGVVTLGQAAY